MASPLTLGLGGYTIVFILAAVLLVIIMLAIFVFRQIRRLRLNSARREVNSSVATEVSKRMKSGITSKIDAVALFRRSCFPKFTDCNMISEHATTPYVNRMIGYDEVIHHVDRQLEFINSGLARKPGQSTYAYLNDVRSATGLTIDDSFIERLAFLHELCRFRTQMSFNDTDLEELRQMLKEFVKILNANQAFLSALALPAFEFGIERRKSKRLPLPEEVPLLSVDSGSPKKVS